MHFFANNGVRQGDMLSPKLFHIYIDGLSTILNNYIIAAHWVVSALTTCYMLMTYASYLSGNHIDFAKEVKYLGVLLNFSIKTSIDVSRQTRKIYAQANMLLRNFRYCINEVTCSLYKSFCTNMYYCALWFNSTSSSVKKLKCSYNSVSCRLLCIHMPYSASAMFVTHGIPSFYVLLRKYIYNFSERISSSRNSIIKTIMFVANNVYFLTHKTLVAFSIILNSSQFYLIPMKYIIYY